jgi:hypothetical protein
MLSEGVAPSAASVLTHQPLRQKLGVSHLLTKNFNVILPPSNDHPAPPIHHAFSEDVRLLALMAEAGLVDSRATF